MDILLYLCMYICFTMLTLYIHEFYEQLHLELSGREHDLCPPGRQDSITFLNGNAVAPMIAACYLNSCYT